MPGSVRHRTSVTGKGTGMGLFAKLRGTERTPAAEAAVERLAAALPEDWRLTELRRQMFCAHP